MEENFEELFNKSNKDIKLGKTVTGKIIEITAKKEIIVDLGYKADGIIYKEEYSFNENEDPNDEFKIGDNITADVLKLNDGFGNVLLSYKKVKSREARKEIEEIVDEDLILEEEISEVLDKGFLVRYKGIGIFIPISLSGISREETLDSYKGKKIRFKITECDMKNNRIIGSVKKVKQEQEEKEQEEFWNSIEEGKTYEGTVESVSSYGAFVNLGKASGLLHVSEMSWSKNANPNNFVKPGEKIKVVIKTLDKENKRIQLASLDKGENPWDKIDEKYNINDVVTVTITKLMPFGAFAELEDGIEGLVHISQISEQRISKPEEILRIGQKANAKILDIDREKRKIELSIRELEGTSREYLEE